MKNCILCAHFWLSAGHEDWSEETPGDDFKVGCRKNLWPSLFDGFTETEESFRERLTVAKKCPEFLHHSKVKPPELLYPHGLNWTGGLTVG